MTTRNQGPRALSLLTASAATMLATAAYAQPASTDLGTITAGVPVSFTANVPAAGSVTWYRFTTTDTVSACALKFLDVDSAAPGVNPITGGDPEIGVYNSLGALMSSDDEDGPGSYSALSFGSGSSLTATGGTLSNGRDGVLAPGTYYLCVSGFSTTHNATAWNATSTSTRVGDVNVTLSLGSFTPPTPPTAIDLGTMATIDTRSDTQTLAASSVQWYKVVTSDVSAALGNYLDMDTENTLLSGTNATRLGVYNIAGRLVTTDLTDGSGSLSQITYGQTTPTRPAFGSGLAYNGRDGALPGCTYYIAVAAATGSSFTANGFTATSTSTITGSLTLRMVTGAPETPPTATPSSVPAIVGFKDGLIRVAVTPGANPASTGITVSADLTTLGGSPSQALFDNGTNGDAVAGDNTYSFNIIGAATPATYALPYTVADAQLRTATGNISLSVQGMTDLGTLTTPQQVSSPSITIPTASVTWFKFVIPSVSVGDANWLDCTTSATLAGGTFTSDTHIGLYNSSGALATGTSTDDDDGNAATSALTYGLTTPVRDNGDGPDHNGRDGSLAAGTYYMAVGGFSCTFGAGFTATSTSNHTSGAVGLSLDLGNLSNPSITGNASSALAGGTALVTGTVIAGNNPPSISYTVTGNFSSLGGSATQTMYDDGTNGDVSIGDNIFSYAFTVSNSQAAGNYNVPLSVLDDQNRPGAGNATVAVDDAGDVIANAKPVDGVGPVTSVAGVLGTNDADMFRLHICDPANFSASTAGGTTVDTQLFLFRADGTGIVTNDDHVTPTTGLQSTITNAFTSALAAGDYYLAVSQFDKDPLDSGNLEIWNDQAGSPLTYRIEHAPDGPGMLNGLDHWSTITGTGGAYTISFTGVSGESCGPVCGSADFDGDGDTGTDLDIEAFFACLGGDCCATCGSADFDGDGDTGTDLDIEAFFRVLGGGEC